MSSNIQSITIPSHTTVKDFTEYNLSITTTSAESYSRSHRYSHFKQLLDQLSAQIGSDPPGTFPSKRAGSWTGSVTSLIGLGKGDLAESEKVERRQGLERWLRGLVTNRDPRWSECHSFREFLAPPQSSEKGGESGEKRGQREFTPATWLTTHQHLVLLSRSIKTTFTRRDALMSSGDATGHAVTAEGKKGLLDLVIQLQELTVGLKELAKSGMTEGELQRRTRMLGTIQDEVEALGNAANTIPRASSSASRYSSTPEPASASRSALLGSTSAAGKAPSRVLGLGATTPQETAQTRPLDNQGLLQLQQTYVDQQDSKLDSLTAVLRRQRDLGMMIGRELEEQSELLEGIDRDVDRVKGKLSGAKKQVKRLG